MVYVIDALKINDDDDDDDDDLFLSPISRYSVWDELTSHNPFLLNSD